MDAHRFDAPSPNANRATLDCLGWPCGGNLHGDLHGKETQKPKA
jgi:hypothetical protein